MHDIPAPLIRPTSNEEDDTTFEDLLSGWSGEVEKCQTSRGIWRGRKANQGERLCCVS